MMQNMRKALQESWRQLRDKPLSELLEARFEKLIGYGKFKEAEAKS
jgi:acetyl-CoA carboxylase carboxyl transferase subunit alpha